MNHDVTFLIVDDDEVDVRALKEMFAEYKITNPVVVASDGVQALEILRGADEQPPLPRPYLILLDLKMPQMNGIEFLEALRKDPHLHDSIVFVLTTSDDDKDKTAAYKRHIAGYLLKSRAGDEFIHAVKMLDHFVLSVRFPDPP